MSVMRMVTTEDKVAERAAHNVVLHAHSLHALASNKWPSPFEFSFVEEEVREHFVSLSINLRRFLEIRRINRNALPAMASALRATDGSEYIESDLWKALGIGAHLQWLKCAMSGSIHSPGILHLVCRSDKLSLALDPTALTVSALKYLKLYDKIDNL